MDSTLFFKGSLNVPMLKVFDPYAYYEKTKLKNFQESSRLEGIQMDHLKVGTTLKDILNKYRR